jgi:hypothetical protein
MIVLDGLSADSKAEFLAMNRMLELTSGFVLAFVGKHSDPVLMMGWWLYEVTRADGVLPVDYRGPARDDLVPCPCCHLPTQGAPVAQPVMSESAISGS